MDRPYVIVAFGYALLGLLLGISMRANYNPAHFPAYAHILLLGFVTSFIYGVCYRLWALRSNGLLARIQFLTHQLGTAALGLGLFLLYGRYAPPAIMEPVVGAASVLVLIGMVLMLGLFLQARRGQVT